VRIVVAPDKLKGTLTAFEAASAIARGLAGHEVVLRPMADGGEGTLDVLVAAARARGERVEVATVPVTGPLGARVEAELAMIDGRAIIESARACGLQHGRDPLGATSRGVGELLLEAARRGAREIWVALGGTATTDGGAGLARALGARFVDAEGRELPEGGAALERLERVELAPRALPPVVALVDVKTPLLGEKGAARVFSPQKGASPAEVERLERGLARLAYRTRPEAAAREGAGAAGGMGFGLQVFAKATLVQGAPRVAAAIGLDEAITGASLVVTGEGRLDPTTFQGKAVRHVLARARALGVPGAIVAGTADPTTVLRVRELGVKRVVTLADLANGDVERAKRDAAALCERAARELLAELAPGL